MNQELAELEFLLAELKKRQEHGFTKYQPLTHPQCNQAAFHQSNAWCRLVFGGNRSGKSRCSAQEDLWWLTNTHPYIKTPPKPRIWVISPEYRIIYEGVWSHLRNSLPHWMIEKIGPKIQGWDIPTFIESKNGGRIDFISAEGGDSDRRKVQAAEIDLLHIDEEINSDLWDELLMRLLTRGGKIIVSATLVNSEEWLLNLEQQSINGDKDISVHRLNTIFNSYNDQAALTRILSKLSPEEQEVRIQGRARRFKGLIYHITEKHQIEPFIIPDHWPRIMAFDPGYRIAAALWAAIDENQRGYLYREMYLPNSNLGEVSRFIKSSEGWELIDGEWRPKKPENIALRLIDPSAFRHLEDGSVGVGLQLSNNYNLHFSPAINDMDTKIEAARHWLQEDLTGVPGVRYFKSLTNFHSEITRYRQKQDNTKKHQDSAPDRPLRKDNHLMDCFGYISVHRPTYYRSVEQEFKSPLLKAAYERHQRLTKRRTDRDES